MLYLAHAAPHYPYQGRDEPAFYTRKKGKTKNRFRPGGLLKAWHEDVNQGVKKRT